MEPTQTIANMNDPAYSSDVAKEVSQKRYLSFLCHAPHTIQKVLKALRTVMNTAITSWNKDYDVFACFLAICWGKTVREINEAHSERIFCCEWLDEDCIATGSEDRGCNGVTKSGIHDVLSYTSWSWVLFFVANQIAVHKLKWLSDFDPEIRILNFQKFAKESKSHQEKIRLAKLDRIIDAQ